MQKIMGESIVALFYVIMAEINVFGIYFSSLEAKSAGASQNPTKPLLQILVHLKGWPFLPGRRPLEYYDFVLSNLKIFFLTLDNR